MKKNVHAVTNYKPSVKDKAGIHGPMPFIYLLLTLEYVVSVYYTFRKILYINRSIDICSILQHVLFSINCTSYT